MLEAWLLLSYSGDEAAYIMYALLIYSLLDGFLGYRLVAGLALASSATVLLKTWLRLPRPPSVLWLAPAHGPGFPSGHAALSAAFWTLLYMETRDRRLALAGIVHSLLVSYSRLALRVHYPFDVAGGLLLGIAASLASSLTFRVLGNRVSPGLDALPLAVASLLLCGPAVAVYPGYSSAQRLLGISLGLAAALVLLPRLRDCQEHLETHDPLVVMGALAVSFSALVMGLALEEAGARVPGFALFTLAVVLSRPLAGLLRRRYKPPSPPN